MTVSHDRGALKSRFARHTRHMQQHPRLAISAALGIILYFLLPAGIGESTRLLAAFDLAATGFLTTIWIMMTRDHANMRRRAVRRGGPPVVRRSARRGCLLLSIAFARHPRPAAGPPAPRVALAFVTIHSPGSS
jgi:hypothetical protein